ncbi:MAG: ATP-grasp domain-containing protein, partial [Gammaproteobacteria bacterium]|nr:ATP-grasp domain-containing protein [Gammaproteobacteria bacterium]
ATACRLADHGLPAVATHRMHDRHEFASGPWVLKPDDGVGCEGARLCADSDELRDTWVGMGRPAGYIAQPYVYGEPASLSLLCQGGEIDLLCINRQRMNIRDNRFSLNTCEVNALSDHRALVVGLVECLGAALPGLWGYAGVDLILHESAVTLLEVNPRLTTSYAGLKTALGVNPAQLVLSLAAGCDPGLGTGAGGAETIVEVELDGGHGL